MIDYIRQILAGQYGASLAMLRDCIASCAPEHWEGMIANGSFRYVAYHTLFFTDLYLTRHEHAFELRDQHVRGGDEREDKLSLGLSKEETLAYALICRDKVTESLAQETDGSLQAYSGFSWRKFSRGELHIYNIRHIQHHTGQLSAYLRRVDPQRIGKDSLRWIGSGWR
jgi:uncharacterized damage-inducible protein DinB